MSFDTQTVSVVVGGASGIGKAVADALSLRPGRVEIASRKTGLSIDDDAAVEAWFARLGPVDFHAV